MQHPSINPAEQAAKKNTPVALTPAMSKQAAGLSVQIRTAYLTEDKQAKAVELAKAAIMDEKMSASPRDIAGHIKTGFDSLYGPPWHCIVGRSFGSYVTHGNYRSCVVCITNCGF